MCAGVSEPWSDRRKRGSVRITMRYWDSTLTAVRPDDVPRICINAGIYLNTTWLQFEVAIDRPYVVGPGYYISPPMPFPAPFNGIRRNGTVHRKESIANNKTIRSAEGKSKCTY